MPLQDTSADADEFSTLEDIIDFSNEVINGGSVNQMSPQPCSNSTMTTSCTQLGNERFASTNRAHALDFQKEQLPALRGTSLDSDVYLEGLGAQWDEIPELGWISGNDFVNECSFSSLAADIDTATDLDIIHVNDREDRKNRFHSSGSPISVLECSKEEVAISNQYIVNKGGASTLSRVPGRVRSKRKRSEACLWNTRILANCNQSEADALSSRSSLIRSCNSSASSYDRNAFFHDYDEELEEEHASMHPRVLIKGKIKLHSSKAKSSSTLAASNHHQAKLSAKKAESVQKIKATTAPSIITDYYYCDDHDINDRSRVSMRKCSHCGSQTTPQWRAGPMGPKTLCNAYGVRYIKSGRLLPEYRPAASPTFQEALHSNSHRRVLEMHMSNKLAAAGADRVSVAARPSLLGTTGHQLSIYIGHHAWAPSTQHAYNPPP